ncbi:cation:proton antiporter [bacterium]|nr:cation:proton antiporter [bacterium]
MENLQPHGFLQDLALVLVVAAVTTVLFQRLKQPVVLGYLLAGLIVGPHIPIPLFADLDRIHTLSELGIILVMFAIGLEFSFRKLASLATTAGITAVIQICVMLWLGYVVGLSFGWTSVEALFTGAMISISSTMIIAKAFQEQSITGKISDLVMGILIVEDLAAILLLAVLTAFSTGSGIPGMVLATTGTRLIGFLLIALVLGILIIPRSIRAVARLNSSETLLIASVGVCFAYSYIAQKVGYSVALGAFLAGSLVAESGHTAQIEHLVRPLRDIFAAVFFISVGMLMNPLILLQHWPAVLVITVAVLLGKILSVSLGSFLTGSDVRTSVKAGFSMAQIGEFSFIIALAGLSSGAIREFLYPVSIAVCVITTFTTPALIRISDRTASFVDRLLPDRLKTVATLYSSWVEKMRTRPAVGDRASIKKRIFRVLLFDMVFITGIVIGYSLNKDLLRDLILKYLHVNLNVAPILLVFFIALISLPFLISIVSAARTLGANFAADVLPENSKLDLAEAPRKTMTLLLEFLTVLTTAIILLTVTVPFLPRFSGFVILAIVFAVFGFTVWRGATDLHAHVRAGAQVIIEALAKESESSEITASKIEQILPGLGNIVSIQLTESHAAVVKNAWKSGYPWAYWRADCGNYPQWKSNGGSWRSRSAEIR